MLLAKILEAKKTVARMKGTRVEGLTTGGLWSGVMSHSF
jgi:hypothetical protein